VPGSVRSVNSTAVLGVIQVVPKDPFPFWYSCLMSTAGQARDPSPFLALLDRNQTIPAYEEKEKSSSLQSQFSTHSLGLGQATCPSPPPSLLFPWSGKKAKYLHPQKTIWLDLFVKYTVD
jgi:hypothetical protein